MKDRIKCKGYEVLFGNAHTLLDALVADEKYTQIAILVDENSSKLCLPQIKENVDFPFNIIELKGGEKNKNLEQCKSIWTSMISLNLDRKSLLINLGGGVIGDMGGFCASIFMRGIDFIQIPTTLLSQVDASVGGKLGVDFESLKNYLGTFNFPKAVIIDRSFLETLPRRQIKNGYAELIKHALILDKDLWREIQQESIISTENIESKVFRSVSLKQGVVEKDPLESGPRKILNFGHSIGHAIESHSLKLNKDILHGEAIMVGMICSAYISNKRGKLSSNELKEVLDYSRTHFSKIEIDSTEIDAIIDLISKDKKNEGSRKLFTLLLGLGNCEYDQEVNNIDIKESLNFYINL